MALSDDLIDFDLIESHKENIRSLPQGRSARQLSSTFALAPTTTRSGSPTLDQSKTLNDAIRQEYELELQAVDDSDDPLDIYNRYIKWTFDAYPSAESTPQSQLLPLLEKATKAFLTSVQYKNDPRYLRIWLHYIHLFSDAPRETFAFLAQHKIGDRLALFYEEFAAWLEGAGRWAQADEVFRLGVEQVAMPAERLSRRYEQFRTRFEARSQDEREATSPAMPTAMRPALAAKIDPFASTSRDEQPITQPAIGGAPSRSGKPKMAIFSDPGKPKPLPTGSIASGWDNIGSIKDRKKENTIEAKPWTGETLKAGAKVGSAGKMPIFKDPKPRANEVRDHQPCTSLATAGVVNPRTGRAERVFVNLEAVYPNEQEEFSFEELRAMSRNWSARTWGHKKASPLQDVSGNASRSPKRQHKFSENLEIENISDEIRTKAFLSEKLMQDTSPLVLEDKPKKERRLKVREVKQETQTVKTRLESPTGRGKLRRKNSAEPTMTFHSKAATNEIYELFNQVHEKNLDDVQSGDDTDYGDDGYSTAGESTGTGRISGNTSEFDDTLASVRSGQENLSSQPDSVSPWSDFTASKHVPRSKHRDRQSSGDITENMDSSQNQTQTSGFDTQALQAIVAQNCGDFDTKLIAIMAGADQEEESELEQENTEDLKTPVENKSQSIEVQNKPRYVPLPPEDYEPTPLRPFRDREQVHQNRLPFMTPIVEKTESSLGANTAFTQKDYFLTKTPSKHVNGHGKYESPSKLKLEEILISSPQQSSPSPKRKLEDHTGASEVELLTSPQKKALISPKRIERTQEPTPPPEQQAPPFFKTPALPVKILSIKAGDPIIQDVQCNPVDHSIRMQILASIDLSAYPGYHDHSSERSQHYTVLKKYVDKVASKVKCSPRKNGDKTTQAMPPILNFDGTNRVYAVKRLLGKGAFAPVYLVDSYEQSADENSDHISQRSSLEAIKTESPPFNAAWEFHILRLLAERLRPHPRALNSIIQAQEVHVFVDEAFLVLDYHHQGTLLDLVNWTREERIKSGKGSGEGLEEVLAIYFSIELLQITEALHSVGVMHGDLKGDNVLLRLSDMPLSSPFSSSVSAAEPEWQDKGLTLIDFGRGIDTYAFRSDASFIADWEADTHDCAELREKRPWKWQLDYFGVAGVVHTLLFGKDICTVEAGGSAVSDIGLAGKKNKTWKLREGLKRYWQQQLWGDLYHALINSSIVSAEGGQQKDGRISAPLAEIRVKMERWLEAEGERKDLRGSLRRAERLVAEKTRGRR